MMDEQKRAWAEQLEGKIVGGRYLLGKPLGIGGMGGVFDGLHQAVGRPVAVKLLTPQVVHKREAIRRFQLEAQSAASISRKGVVDILDFDVDPELGPYLVMEKLRGQSLLERIKSRGRVEPTEALSIALEIVETLATVHARGIIHRDLKPANVFLALTDEDEEVVKLLDFGISRVSLAPGSAPLTVPGTVLGTPRFMSPEQARCEPDVDHRTDLYGVGALMYFALAGTKPYADVPRNAMLTTVMSEAPVPLVDIMPGLIREIYELVAHAMERDRDRRYQTAEAMGRVIRQVLELAESSRELPPLTADDDEAPTEVESAPSFFVGGAGARDGGLGVSPTPPTLDERPRASQASELSARQARSDGDDKASKPPPTLNISQGLPAQAEVQDTRPGMRTARSWPPASSSPLSPAVSPSAADAGGGVPPASTGSVGSQPQLAVHNVDGGVDRNPPRRRWLFVLLLLTLAVVGVVFGLSLGLWLWRSSLTGM